MYRYLSDKTADYVDTIFDVSPTTILPQTGNKNQIIHEVDDGTVSVVGIAENVFFDVILQWSFISNTDYETVMDFWFDDDQGDGYGQTFYWHHPIDGKYYTVRFTTPLTASYDPVGNLSINQITLRVEGNKPDV